MEFQFENLVIEVENSDGVLKMNWSGRSDIIDVNEISDDFFQEILNLNFQNARIDLINLTFISSTTLIIIIKLLKSLNDLTKNTVVIYNENSTWQRGMLKAITMAIRNLDYIQVKSMNEP